MDVHLTPDQERLVSAALRSGRYRNASEVLDDALRTLSAGRSDERLREDDKLQAIQRLRNFGTTHRLSLGGGLTIKDLINEGRR